MIVTLDYFDKGRYKIPNIRTAPNSTSRADEVQEYIDIFEQEILTKGLGVDLYNVVVSSYQDIENSSEEIKNLVNGTTYESNSKSLVWEGINHKYSLLTSYIYYKWTIENQTYSSGLGEKIAEAKNAESVSAIPKAVSAYREFFEKYQGNICGYDPIIIRRNSGLGIDWLGEDNSKVSLYRYLKENSDVYPSARFSIMENINTFGV